MFDYMENMKCSEFWWTCCTTTINIVHKRKVTTVVPKIITAAMKQCFGKKHG